MKRSRSSEVAKTGVRCAIYTRKSTEEGLDQEFNSLDAQRESAEAFVKSQTHEGWECLPTRYDDGGYTGGNIERPALKQLLADIEKGGVDCVVVYKVDRLSRSLLDFTKMMEAFGKHGVTFVAFTQQINTANPMGRLMLNVLMSFAQFERELISERTRDKIAAARRKGKWAGGHPILGYDIDPRGFKLVVNEEEARRVRAIFELYLEHEALMPVVGELERRGWLNKRWTTRKGQERGGKPFTKTSLHKLLTNVAYTGQVRFKSEIHPGEHEGIVATDVWQRTQAVLGRNGRTGGALVRNRFGSFLKGLLRCVPCDCAMVPSHTTREGKKRYRYYTCCGAQKRGWHTCPSKAIPAGQIESFVVEQIRGIGRDQALVNQIFAQTNQLANGRLAELQAEQKSLSAEMARWNDQVRQLSGELNPDQSNGSILDRLADIHERIRGSERRLGEVRMDLDALKRGEIDEGEVRRLLAEFDPLWQALTPREQGRLVQLLINRIDYDGAKKKVAITFQDHGLVHFAQQLEQKEKSA